MPKRIVLLLLIPSLPSLLRGEDAPSGEEMVREFLARETRAIARSAFAGVRTLEDWERRAPELRAELREMLGLRPEPPRADLWPVVTGIVDREDLGLVVEKLHFQSLPRLYVTANLYRPRTIRGKLPAVLYLCGHGQVKAGGVAYGSKVHYQHHPAWFARNGFVCLVIDTLQFGEIEGYHHGTYRLDMWWWVSRGYTPAGVETWNAMRALDYLLSRPEVDRSRAGVTGRSGGGIGSWWLGALDDRVSALVPVAGITDLENHIVGGVIEGHCDCNFPVNLYRWDFPLLAALSAPRPVLHANTDKDRIFPLDGVVRLHFALRDVYGWYGKTDRLGLLITEGPHRDTQELQVPAFRWMERWLRSEPDRPVTLLAEKFFEPEELKVFRELPEDEINTRIHETFVPRAPEPEVPGDRAAFETLREELLSRLRRKTFRNAPLELSGSAAAPEARSVRDGAGGGFIWREVRFRSEGPFELPLWVIFPKERRPIREVALEVLDEEGSEALGGRIDRLALSATADGFELPSGCDAIAYLAPRGIGPTRWTDDPGKANQIRRRFLVIGRTLEETWIHDARQAIRLLSALPELGEARIRLRGRGDMAAVALYAAIFEPRAESLELFDLPSSHREGIALLNVLRVLDLPQALALVFPRPVTLHGASAEAFSWTRRAAELFAGGAGDPSPPLTFASLPRSPR